MLWRNFCGFVALFVLANAQSYGPLHRWESSAWKVPHDNLIDIDVENDKNGDPVWQDGEDMSGSGSGMDTTDDEDLVGGSGSGSGAGAVPDFPDIPTTRTPAPTTTTTTTTTTISRPTTPAPPSKPRTPCEQLREASQHLAGNYVPRCNVHGDYAVLQCHGAPRNGSCWCADLRGLEVPGTALVNDIPDCTHGKNLPLCIFQLLWQMRNASMSGLRPKCMFGGQFERTQCHGTRCHCVDPETGNKIMGTEVFLPDRPNCDGPPPPEKEDKEDKHEHKITLFPPVERTTPRMEVEVQTKVNVNLEGKDKDKDSEEEEEEEEGDDTPIETNNTGDDREPVKEPSSAASMMTQPGILAAIIGGSVVLLLCAILLAMFIIYRMKKKDEGSYPLDEPKKMPNYSYQRAPEKEFYA